MSLNIKGGLVAAASVMASIGAWANTYTIVDLGSNYAPVGVNRIGVVAATLSEPKVRGQVYRDGHWRNLPRHSQAYAINRQGDVVGDDYYLDKPMLWPHNGDPVVISLPGGISFGHANDVNDSSIVVGKYAYGQSSRCFMWSPNGKSISIGDDQWRTCAARGVNNSRQITGGATIDGGTDDHAFLWIDGEFTDLGAPGTPVSEGVTLNDDGVVIGYGFNDPDAPEAFVWNGVMTMLDPAFEYYASMPLSINNHGDIVGWVKVDIRSDPVAVRFAHSGIFKLISEVVDADHWKLRSAAAINDKGVIVGTGELRGVPHGYMLVPQK